MFAKLFAKAKVATNRLLRAKLENQGKLKLVFPFSAALLAICRFGTALCTDAQKMAHTCTDPCIDNLICEEHLRWPGVNC
jgi:hypothetical protein